MKKLIFTFLFSLIFSLGQSQVCETLDFPNQFKIENNNTFSWSPSKQVGIDIVCDSQFTQRHGGFMYTKAYITDTLFPVIQADYAKDNISIYLANTFVYIGSDPYFGHTSSSQAVIAFQQDMIGNKNGDQHLLISGSDYNLGGAAFVGTLGTDYNVGYVNIPSWSNINVKIGEYNWATHVIEHELGHALGSQHNHWCGWRFGPIDTCYTPEGGCYIGPNKPILKGHTMSYCHLNGAIDPLLGMGYEPDSIILKHINDRESYLIHPDTVIGNTFSMYSSDITTSSAKISWTNLGEKYKYKYKLANTIGWFSIIQTTSNEITLQNLQQNKKYKWKIKYLSNGTWTDFFPDQIFYTLKP